MTASLNLWHKKIVSDIQGNTDFMNKIKHFNFTSKKEKTSLLGMDALLTNKDQEQSWCMSAMIK